MLQFWLPKYISGLEWLAWAFQFSLSGDLVGSFCPWEVSVRAVVSRRFPTIFWLGLARSLALPNRLHIAEQVPPVSPRFTKSWISGCSKTPLNVSPTTCPGPAGNRRWVGAPAISRPEAHFLHPGRGGRQTSERWGWLSVSSGDHHRPARRGKGRSSDPGCSWGRRGRQRSLTRANAKAAVRELSGEGPRKTA